jgi:hypothetical protein
MRLLFLACAAGALAGCASIGNVEDDGRTFQRGQDAPVSANLEPLAAEPTIVLNDRIPGRGQGSSGSVSEDSACMAERWQHLIGATRAQVEAEALPANVRLIEWGAMVTQDYVPARMNVHLDQNGRVYRVICG